MIVYRVESTEYVDPRTGLGAGPFAGMWYCAAGDVRWGIVHKLLLEALESAGERGITLPTPSQDPLLCGIDRDEVCGVESRKALDLWFGENLAKILELGYVVVEYDVPRQYARRGLAGQVLFQFAKINSRKEEHAHE
jgi:hypothetical protein